MKVKEQSEKVGLKLIIQKTKIMAYGPITLWQIDGETVKTLADFTLGASKITADGDCNHEIKRYFSLRESYDQPRQHIIKQRHYFTNKGLSAAAKSLQSCPTLCDPIDGSPPGSPVPRILQARTLKWVAISFSKAWKWKVKVKLLSRVQLLATPWTAVKAMVFPVVMSGCESWTIKKAEHWKIDAFELWCWRRLLRVPRMARRSNQSILKEISPEYSLEGLMLKLKLQYFGHLMRRADSFEKTLMLGKIEGREERGITGWLKEGGEGDDRGWDGWMASLTQWTWVWVGSRSWWWTGRPGVP